MADLNRLLGNRALVIVSILLFNALSWYYMTLTLASKAYPLSDQLWIVYYFAIILASIVGSLAAHRIERLHILYVWMILGTVASIFLAFLSKDLPVLLASLIFSFLGFSFGIGMPSCLAFFGDHTDFKNRGTLGGAVILCTILTIPVVTMSFEAIDMVSSASICAVWRGLGLVFLALAKQTQRPKTPVRGPMLSRYRFVFRDKTFVRYVIPWLMFNFINQFEDPILRQLSASFLSPSVSSIGPLIGAIVAFLSGFLSDRVGRKRIVILGFVFLGIGYAALGLASDILFVWYFFLIVESVAWGILFVNFVVVLWGDLSKSDIKEEYYVVGSIPFFSVSVIGLLLLSAITFIPAYAVFSLASFFLFLAVLPLMYASETLPDTELRQRELRQYVEKAKKVKDRGV